MTLTEEQGGWSVGVHSWRNCSYAGLHVQLFAKVQGPMYAKLFLAAAAACLTAGFIFRTA